MSRSSATQSRATRVIDLPALARPLMRRIENGADLLFQMEQRGEMGPDYERWVATYVSLVEDFDAVTKQIILTGQTTIDAKEEKHG